MSYQRYGALLMIIMGHQISSCHVPVVRSFFIL
jgi:hypothetical protein